MFIKKLQFIILFVSTFLLASCDLLIPQAPIDSSETNVPDATYTSVAETVIAQVTQAANPLIPTITPIPPIEENPPTVVNPTITLAPSSTIIPTFTPVPPQPTYTPLPTYTPYPTPTPIPCHQVLFVKDVTIADGTGLVPKETFVKTWRLKNIGSCTWTTAYDLVFMSGERMNGKSAVSLPYPVAPGETVDISIDLMAPEDPGIYQGNYQLRTADGKTFGLGDLANKSFWVKISVLDINYDQVYSFVISACKAKWTSGAGVLPCPGQAGDTNGFIQFLPAPLLENGRLEDEPALWMHPQFINEGWIQVEYPAFQIYPDDKFVTIIGCLKDHPNCKAVFTLQYLTENGQLRTFGSWAEIYDDLVNPIEVDLSDLAGQKIRFILRVDAWGNAEADHVFWLNPHITGTPRMDVIPFCPKCE